MKLDILLRHATWYWLTWRYIYWGWGVSFCSSTTTWFFGPSAANVTRKLKSTLVYVCVCVCVFWTCKCHTTRLYQHFVYMCVYIYIYIYICICVFVCACVLNLHMSHDNSCQHLCVCAYMWVCFENSLITHILCVQRRHVWKLASLPRPSAYTHTHSLTHSLTHTQLTHTLTHTYQRTIHDVFTVTMCLAHQSMHGQMLSCVCTCVCIVCEHASCARVYMCVYIYIYIYTYIHACACFRIVSSCPNLHVCKHVGTTKYAFVMHSCHVYTYIHKKCFCYA